MLQFCLSALLSFPFFLCPKAGFPHERPTPLQAKQSQQANFGSFSPFPSPFWSDKSDIIAHKLHPLNFNILDLLVRNTQLWCKWEGVKWGQKKLQPRVKGQTISSKPTQAINWPHLNIIIFFFCFATLRAKIGLEFARGG
jgi:hypothetical protein